MTTPWNANLSRIVGFNMIYYLDFFSNFSGLVENRLYTLQLQKEMKTSQTAAWAQGTENSSFNKLHYQSAQLCPTFKKYHLREPLNLMWSSSSHYFKSRKLQSKKMKTLCWGKICQGHAEMIWDILVLKNWHHLLKWICYKCSFNWAMISTIYVKLVFSTTVLLYFPF